MVNAESPAETGQLYRDLKSRLSRLRSSGTVTRRMTIIFSYVIDQNNSFV